MSETESSEKMSGNGQYSSKNFNKLSEGQIDSLNVNRNKALKCSPELPIFLHHVTGETPERKRLRTRM